MITPYFTVTQDDEFVRISVKVSHVRFSAQALEMVVDSEVFIFSLAPYYLRLRFAYPMIDDERAHAEFKDGCVEIKVPKENKGQLFPDLDLTAKLLARKEPEPKKPLIEELDVKNEISSGDIARVDGESHDWEIHQEVEQPVLGPLYGFNNAYNTIVGVSTSNGNDINELGDPETASPSDRVLERLIKENIKFDPEYYAADYIMEKHPSADDDKDFKGIFAWKSPATRQFVSWYKLQEGTVMPVEFTKEEQERMLELPRKSYLVDEAYKPQLFVLIVSLLFAYHYDLRENEGEHNIESAWTVGKLVPQFAFLDSQLHNSSTDNILRAGMIGGVRRALSYPYHRNYRLAMKVWDDVYYALRGGKRMVLKCLLDAKELFRYHDVYYVYDKIWMEDLCLWVISDHVSEAAVRDLAHDVKKQAAALQKSDITFEKLDDTQDDDAMVVLDVNDVEMMADDSYGSYVPN